MSHNHERTEKDCLNCDTTVYGRFCHVCGQENIETRESFWALAKHFIYDILHFDGKFFHTVGYLFSRPGFVARQYAEGKRAAYLHPIRMYLFTSALFFLVFFSTQEIQLSSITKGPLNKETRIELAKEWQKAVAKNPNDTAIKKDIALLLDTTKPLVFSQLARRNLKKVTVSSITEKYASVAAYQQVQDTLPDEKKDSWLGKKITIQSLHIKEKYGDDKESINAFLEACFHKLPYLLFLSLPFFALLLKLLYVRRKNFYYSDHAVFTLYHYILSFILLLLLLGLNKLQHVSHWAVAGYLLAAVALSWPVYLFLQMKQFYRQGVLKTLVKFLLLNFLAFIVILGLFVLFLVLTLFQL